MLRQTPLLNSIASEAVGVDGVKGMTGHRVD